MSTSKPTPPKKRDFTPAQHLDMLQRLKELRESQGQTFNPRLQRALDRMQDASSTPQPPTPPTSD